MRFLGVLIFIVVFYAGLVCLNWLLGGKLSDFDNVTEEKDEFNESFIGLDD